MLIVGGDGFAPMAMAMDQGAMRMSDMQQPDTSCDACGRPMAGDPCEAACTSPPAIDTAAAGLSDAAFRPSWIACAETGAIRSVRPDPSPPRA